MVVRDTTAASCIMRGDLKKEKLREAASGEAKAYTSLSRRDMHLTGPRVSFSDGCRLVESRAYGVVVRPVYKQLLSCMEILETILSFLFFSFRFFLVVAFFFRLASEDIRWAEEPAGLRMKTPRTHQWCDDAAQLARLAFFESHSLHFCTTVPCEAQEVCLFYLYLVEVESGRNPTNEGVHC